jgi:Flp pilus assembly protein TadD
MEHFAASLKINPNSATTHNNMGMSLAITGRISEAVEQFEAALKINPDYTAARNNLSQMQATLEKNPPSN